MSTPRSALAAALSCLLLASCGGPGPAVVENEARTADGNAADSAVAADPAGPGPDANAVADPLPPPDAVSHPDGYLPPAPAEPDPAPANSSGPGSPATEDEYIRNQTNR